MRKEKTISDNYISKTDSLILYGIAILLMVFHHCFCEPERLNFGYIPVFFSYEVEARLAYIGKLCVAFYAFITGYAFAKKIINQQRVMGRIFEDIKISLSTLLKFYSKFWFVCIIFIPIGIVFFGHPLNLDSVAKTLIIGGGGYNGEWWYVYQYIKFLFVFPFLDVFLFCISKKELRKSTCLTMAICTITLIVVRNSVIGTLIIKFVKTLYSPYMIIFVMSFLIGRTKIFEYMNKRIVFPSLFYFLIILLLLVARWCLVSDPRDMKYDILISPILIFSIVQLIHNNHDKESRMLKLLAYFGKYSTYIWLVHTFWIYYYFQDIVLMPRYSTLIFIWAFIISLLNAIALTAIQNRLKIDRIANDISGRILKFPSK